MFWFRTKKFIFWYAPIWSDNLPKVPIVSLDVLYNYSDQKRTSNYRSISSKLFHNICKCLLLWKGRILQYASRKHLDNPRRATECADWPDTLQGRSQNAEKVTHIKGRLLDKVMILYNCVPKWELLLKERICSQREQIISFMSSSL